MRKLPIIPNYRKKTPYLIGFITKTSSNRKMSFKIQFGKIIPGLKIYGEPAEYPVLNERDARAAAGIMLVLAIFAFTQAFLMRQFIFLQIFVMLFLIEFWIRIIVNPDYAPFYALGRLLVKKQIPEYSGAIQKRFAWSLGFILAVSMFFIAIVFGIRGIVPFSICSVCIFLLWAESTLGVCIGCKIYSWLINVGIIKPKVRAACPGGVCSINKK
jgi:hypothetical protein